MKSRISIPGFTKFRRVLFCPALSILLIAGCGKSTAQATLDYWNALGDAISVTDGRHEVTTDDMRRAANRAAGLRTLGVDAEAVAFGLQTAGFLREAANHGDQGINVVVGSFVDGIAAGMYGSGDPMVRGRQYEAIGTALSSQGSAIIQRAQVLRAALTQRYGIEFPPLFRTVTPTDSSRFWSYFMKMPLGGKILLFMLAGGICKSLLSAFTKKRISR